jgi:hypothetical protein
MHIKTTLVSKLAMVTFITKVASIYVVSMVSLLLCLFSFLRNLQAGSGTRLAEVLLRG